jgi:hypothetical protein
MNSWLRDSVSLRDNFLEIKMKIMTSEDPVIEIINAVRLGTTDYDFKTLKMIG